MFKPLSDFLSANHYPQKQKGKKPFYYRKDKRGDGEEEFFDFITLIEKWPSIIGKTMGKNTLPLKIQGKALIILTKHPTFSQELSFMENTIREKICNQFPTLQHKIGRIKFHCNPSFFDKKMKSHPVKGPTNPTTNKVSQLHPYSPEYRRYKKEANEILKDIEDNELKETLRSLYIQRKSDQNK